MKGDFNNFWTTRYVGTNADLQTPVDFSVEFFLQHRKESRAADGTVQETPHLRGISGASIWTLRAVAPPRVWTAEASMKIVGLAIAFKAGCYIRAKKWNLVAQAFDRIDPVAAAEIRRMLADD